MFNLYLRHPINGVNVFIIDSNYKNKNINVIFITKNNTNHS